MRRSRVFITGVLVFGVSLAVSGIAAAAAGDPRQTIAAVVTPKKLPATDLKPAKLQVNTATFYDNGSGGDDTSRIPPKASRAVVSLPDNLEFDTSVVPACKTDISTLSSDAAAAACAKSRVSTTNTTKNAAVAAVPLGPGGSRVNLDAQVLAFNGPKQGGKPTIILHSYIPQLNVTTLLIGVLKNATGKYGHKLDVTVPPLAGGAGALASFSVEIKKGAYVQGTCPSKDKTLHFAGAFTTDVGVLKATDTTKCTSQR